ncbi:Sugar efflux transporter for intercellular exchange [Popillia japonica]|uniref:Sugar efflux transporter for intercellular exchange n=1 Tax=Popillia japonica TaxID=7064 RepID=A0AAW1K5X2_POPJA
MEYVSKLLVEMELARTYLKPYTHTIGMFAAIPSVLLHLTGLIPCYYMYKCHEPQGFPSDMFFANVFIAALGMIMASLISDPLLLVTNIKNDIITPAFMYAAAITVLFGYTNYESATLVVNRFGIIQTVLVMLVHLYPYLDLKKRIQYEEESPTPLPIILLSVCILTLWILYGIATNNIFVVAQNLGSIFLCCIQLMYNIMYSEMRH